MPRKRKSRTRKGRREAAASANRTSSSGSDDESGVNGNRIVRLESRDGLFFDEELKVINGLGKIKDVFRFGDVDYLEINEVSSIPMMRAIEWATHFKDEFPSADENVDDNANDNDHQEYVLSSWEVRFFNENDTSLRQLYEAANFFEMRRLKKALKKAADIRGLELTNV